MDREEDQLEFDFTPEACKCHEGTKYEELCPTCLNECLEYMQDNDDYADLSEYEHA